MLRFSTATRRTFRPAFTIADNGGGWPSNGGHQMGRKWPILFAGQMLDDAHMKNAGQWTVDFQEDLDTFYVSQAEVDMTHSAAWNPDDRASRRAYETADIGLPEWGIRHTAKPETDNMAWDATYRSMNNPAYVGWVLAAHMMGQKQAWNHNPLFDYIDRSTAVGGSGSSGGDFVKNMWQTYRADYSPRWVPYDPANLYSQGQLYYALEIATAGQLPTGKVDEAYSQTLNAAAGKPPYTWAVAAGNLPAGLGLAANSGSITGTPVTTVITNFSIKVTDSAGASVTSTFSLTVLAGTTSITTTNILADPADRSIGLNTNGIPVLGSVSQAAHNIADDNAAYSKADQCAVIMFRLPVLEAGETISTANLALDISAGNIGGGPDPLPKGVDIYGLRYSSSSAVLTNDYGFKTLAGAGDTLIQDNIVQFPSNIVYAYTVYNTDTAGDAALAAWLTAQYTAGAAGGDYVFLRIHADSASANQIYITSANSTSSSNTVPTLTLGIRPAAPDVTDADGDGIPNDWETLHFGGSTNANPNATAANGVNTIYETYIAGLNPTDAQSVFALSNPQSASLRVLQWSCVSGRVYSVYWTTNLLNGFQSLATNILWPQNSWTDEVHGAEAGGFYRIKVHLVQ